jgi:S1-C subfamily serine protease
MEGALTYFTGRTVSASKIEQLDGYVARCDTHNVALMGSLRYDSEGKPIGQISIESRLLRPIQPSPGSPLASQLEFVCTGRTLASGIPSTKTPSPPQEKSKEVRRSSSGTGFAIATNGYLVTNAHVVNDCESIEVRNRELNATARVTAKDSKLDVALLKIDRPLKEIAFWRTSPVNAGEPITALGYPLSGLLASDINVSTGIISALAGISNDATRFQISAPIQNGNSGGPLVDNFGNIVGMVVEKLNAIAVAKITGDIPQNINFAIKADAIRLFLSAQEINIRASQMVTKLDTVAVVAKARAYTFLVICK